MLERKSFVKLKFFFGFNNIRVIIKIQYDSLNLRPTKKLRESVTVSKNELNFLAIFLISVKNLPFSLTTVFDSSKNVYLKSMV